MTTTHSTTIITTILLTTISIITPLSSSTPSPAWRHGWKNVAEMLYMHGGNKTIITPEATTFTAQSYPIVAFANCYGTHTSKNTTEEDAAIITARNLREVEPTVKNVFYWKADLDSQCLQCSNAKSVYSQHPEWRFYDSVTGQYHYDTRNPAVRSFWTNHLLSLAYEMDATNASQPLIDGFFIDGMPSRYPTWIHSDNDPDAVAEWWNGTLQMTHDLQRELDYLNQDQIVIINGLDALDAVPLHESISPSSMVDHFAILQFLNKNTGEWLYEPMRELLFDTIRSPLNENRTLIIKAWPGPIVKQKDIWPNNTQPDTPEGMQEAAAEFLNAALALFLLVAEDTSWFSYSWFWDAGDYVPFGNDHTCPDDFYPVFECPLGEPLGPPEEREGGGEYEYRREYEHASVFVDLKDRNATYVVWHGSGGADPEHCPGAAAAREELFSGDEGNEGITVVDVDTVTSLDNEMMSNERSINSMWDEVIELMRQYNTRDNDESESESESEITTAFK